MKGFLFACLAFSSLAGCAMFRDPPLARVPPERIDNSAYQTPEPGDAHVIVERDNSFYAGGCDFRLLIQGTILARIRTSEWIDLYMRPGPYTLGVTQGCGHDTVTEMQIHVQSGEEKTYKVGTWSFWGGVGGVVITPTASSSPGADAANQ